MTSLSFIFHPQFLFNSFQVLFNFLSIFIPIFFQFAFKFHFNGYSMEIVQDWVDSIEVSCNKIIVYFKKSYLSYNTQCNLQVIRTNATLKFFRKRCYGHYKTVGQNSRGKAGEKPRRSRKKEGGGVLQCSCSRSAILRKVGLFFARTNTESPSRTDALNWPLNGCSKRVEALVLALSEWTPSFLH